MCLTHSLLLWNPVFNSGNLIHIFLIRLLAKQQFSDSLRSWRTRLAMHNANLCNGARDLKLWMSRLKEFGYENMWSTRMHRYMSPIMIEKGWKLYKFCLIVRTAAHLSIILKLKSRCASYATTTRKSGFTWSLMTPCGGQESAGMAWRLFSAFSGISLVLFTIDLW